VVIYFDTMDFLAQPIQWMTCKQCNIKVTTIFTAYTYCGTSGTAISLTYVVWIIEAKIMLIRFHLNLLDY
jgi:hypothetical protein